MLLRWFEVENSRGPDWRTEGGGRGDGKLLCSVVEEFE
jgi:hypothetical protein